MANSSNSLLGTLVSQSFDEGIAGVRVEQKADLGGYLVANVKQLTPGRNR